MILLIVSFSITVATFQTAQARSRPRLERDREYDEYAERELYAHGHQHHLPGAEDYRDRGLDRALERIPPRDHRPSREDDYAPHRGSSRRALNAI